tara:strand:+ start:382 stop:1401 length:1020 start_codon:yes stop_codon:yes gene_type:complete
MKTLVTGAAGFIGYHLTKKLITNGIKVLGIDNFNEYYDPKLKQSRYENLKKIANNFGVDFLIKNVSIEDYSKLKLIAEEFQPKRVVNLAAQAGVRYSIENPSSYVQSNLVGFGNILEICRSLKVENLLYASSSSVYGGNTKTPFKETDSVDHPISLYAASKKANELMAHTYSHLYGLPAIGLRLFTVYGPWGRPDMALFKFTKSIIAGEPIEVYNYGEMKRDFTYIDDTIECIYRLLNKPACLDKSFDSKHPNPSRSWSPHMVFNIGNSQPTKLISFIEAIESELNIKAIKKLIKIQPGDVNTTYADTSLLESWINYKPSTHIEEGIEKFTKWYLSYYR